MELGLLPSEFLSVVLEESDRNGSLSVCTNNNPSHTLSTSDVTILPVIPKFAPTCKKKVNRKHSSDSPKISTSKVLNGVLHRNEYLDLKRRLPRTVLEECIVELADSSSKICSKVPECHENAVTIKPMYAKKPDKSQQPSRFPKSTDFRALFAKVEAVYSDEDEPMIRTSSYGTSVSDGHVNDASAALASDAAGLGYACNHCPNKYPNKGALWQHNVAAHSIEKSCECQLCGRKFYRNCSLALHMKCHSDEQNCSCKICGKEFSRLSMLDRHAKCHNAEVAAVVSCNGGTANSANAVVANGSAPVAAPANAVSSAAAASAINNGVTSSSANTAPSNSPPVAQFTCKICGKTFADEPVLRAHVFAHSERFTCEQCNVTFNTKQLLDLHFHITHKRSETPFGCKLCKARFANLRELNEHAMSHSYEKVRISCHHCGEVFSQRSTYKKHVQLHVGERLSCTICRIDFTQRSSLLRHYKRLHLINDIPHNGGGGAATVVETPSFTIITK